MHAKGCNAILCLAVCQEVVYLRPLFVNHHVPPPDWGVSLSAVNVVDVSKWDTVCIASADT